MILGIIGPNGAGKTTAFNLLNGFLWPSSGQVLLDGRDITRRKPHEVCALGVGRTFQIMRPFMRMSVAENVVVGAYVRTATDEQARRLADEAIAKVGLAPAASRLARELTQQGAPADGAGARARRPAARCCCSTRRSRASARPRPRT